MGTDRDKSRFALAIYEIAGFGLDKVFPNAEYLLNDPTSDAAALTTAVAAMPQGVEQIADAIAASDDQLFGDMRPVIELLVSKLIDRILKRFGL